MDKRGQVRAALAVVAAVAGTGYASGRELVLFFAQTGRASWLGIPFAALVFGLLMALVCRGAARANVGSFAGLCRRLMGPRAAALAGCLHGLMLAATAAMMLAGAGEVGALTLPLRFGFLWGAALALMIALLLNLGQLRGLPWAGLVVFLVGVAFYGALALDPRPVRVYLRGDVRLVLEDSVPAAILLATAYAAMNACLAADVAARFGGRARPAQAGAMCGGMLGVMLLCANGAVARGGKLLYAQALPSVILSARWGAFGFWACAAFGFLCATTTLAAALGGLLELLRHSGRGRRFALTAVGLALACGATGLCRALGAVYAALGWLWAILMLAVARRADPTAIAPVKS